MEIVKQSKLAHNPNFVSEAALTIEQAQKPLVDTVGERGVLSKMLPPHQPLQDPRSKTSQYFNASRAVGGGFK